LAESEQNRGERPSGWTRDGRSSQASAIVCAACGGQAQVQPILDFGLSPLADRLMPAASDAADDPRWPLTLAACPHCGLPQLASQPPPDMLFGGNYPYLSSVSSSWRRHAAALADLATGRFGLGRGDLVVEIASNDGGQLLPFAARGIRVCGVEPSPLPAAEARRHGVPTIDAYFNRALAESLANEHGKARLAIANNVVPHVPDPREVLGGMAVLLDESGVAIVETGYFGAMVEAGIFDTIYHQHRCYFTLRAMEALAARAGLRVFDVETLPTQGGSLRFFLCKASATAHPASENVSRLREAETRAGLGTSACLETYAASVLEKCARIRQFIGEATSRGWRVAGYGAAAKATTLLAACGVGPEQLAYIVDKSPVKQGLRMPGLSLPIVPPETIDDRPVDALLVLAWNLIDEIAEEREGWRNRPKLLCPLPEPRIV